MAPSMSEYSSLPSSSHDLDPLLDPDKNPTIVLNFNQFPNSDPDQPQAHQNSLSSLRSFILPSRRHSRLFFLALIPTFLCLSSLILIAYHLQLLHPQNFAALNSYKLSRNLSDSAVLLSANLNNWLAALPSRLPSSIVSLSNQIASQLNVPLSANLSFDSPYFHPHPILPLLLAARKNWIDILNDQPTSLDDARRAYLSRYHPLQPPPGFDAWFHFARRRNFTLIHRFDGLMADLSPFRALSSSELRRRTRQLGAIHGITLVTITQNATVQLSAPSGRLATGNALKQMLQHILAEHPSAFPPIDLAVNEHSEARVLPRHSRPVSGEEFNFLSDALRAHYESLDPGRQPSLDGFKAEWGQDGSVWDAYRRACPADSAARRLVETIRSAEFQTGAIAAGGGLASLRGTQQLLSMRRSSRRRPPGQGGGVVPAPREMTFLDGIESVGSFCDRPSTHHLHSAFFADQRSIEHLYPLFSPSKPDGFADILLPSHYHYTPRAEFLYDSELKLGRTKTSADMAWTDKAGKMYWRGKITRGADTPPGHMSSFQKQRLVKLVSNDSEANAVLASQAHRQGETDPSWRAETERVLVTFNASSGSILSVAAPATVVDPLLLDIAIACDPHAGECQELNKQGYHTQPPAALSECWKAKFVLDLDDAGFSPRFSALMESRSAVVKMSVHQEFWRDWVQPWYHFIPLSSSYSELHNLITFFTGIPAVLKDKARTIKRRGEILARGVVRLVNPDDPAAEAGGAGPSNAGGGAGLEGFDADEELRKIGEAGRDWKLRHLRQEDMEVYLFRLIIEWARLVNGDP